MTSQSIAQQVEVLEGLGLSELRELWAKRFGPPPKLRSADLMRCLLAWHIQAEFYGGIDGALRRRLGQKGNAAACSLSAGTRIVKEWQGRRYEVLVDHQGPLFEGRRYRSLSEIARAITGTRWNGPRFFGLRNSTEAA